MQTLEATFRIVTPMFLGGADHDVADGIRPPSVKGALRFWWRALNWGQFQREHPTDEAKALRALHTEEARLFGLAADDNKNQQSGQGCFLLSVSPTEALKTTGKDEKHAEFAGHDASRYLAYGLITAYRSNNTGREAGELDRSCLDRDQRFTVKLRFRHSIEPSIQKAVIALGLLGGLGARSRHGIGSLTLDKLVVADQEVWTNPNTEETYQTELNKILPKETLATGRPPFSAFSADSRIDRLETGTSAFQVLNSFGRSMMFYRSWGKDGKVLGKPSEQNFKNDHDWSKATLQKKDFHPRRVMFGLPHNYGQGKKQQVTPATKTRRASPLLFHVHQLTNSQFIGISILLKSDFLPQGEKINAGGTNVPAKIEWSVLTELLDGNDSKDNKRFPAIKNMSGDE